MIRKSKGEYYNKIKETAKKDNNPSMYFKAVSSLKDAEKASQFDITEMFPVKNEEEIGLEVANFFNRITENYEPLKPLTSNPNDPLKVETYQVAAA